MITPTNSHLGQLGFIHLRAQCIQVGPTIYFAQALPHNRTKLTLSPLSTASCSHQHAFSTDCTFPSGSLAPTTDRRILDHSPLANNPVMPVLTDSSAAIQLSVVLFLLVSVPPQIIFPFLCYQEACAVGASIICTRPASHLFLSLFLFEGGVL